MRYGCHHLEKVGGGGKCEFILPCSLQIQLLGGPQIDGPPHAAATTLVITSNM